MACAAAENTRTYTQTGEPIRLSPNHRNILIVDYFLRIQPKSLELSRFHWKQSYIRRIVIFNFKMKDLTDDFSKNFLYLGVCVFSAAACVVVTPVPHKVKERKCSRTLGRLAWNERGPQIISI